MKTRFDLEDEISTLYSFAKQLETLNEGILEYNLSTDEISNVVEGLRVMLELHAQKMSDTMCQCFKLDNYRPNKSSSFADLPG
jgi:hypothetical protein